MGVREAMIAYLDLLRVLYGDYDGILQLQALSGTSAGPTL